MQRGRRRTRVFFDTWETTHPNRRSNIPDVIMRAPSSATEDENLSSTRVWGHGERETILMRAIGEGHHGTFITHHLGASAQKRVGARFSHFPLFAYQPSHKRRRVATRREARSLVSPSPCVFPLRPPRIHHDGVRREEEPVRSLESIPARLHVWPPTKLHPGDRSVHQVRNRHERPGAERTCDGRAGCHLARRFTSRRPGPGITCPFASTGIVPSGSDGTESSCECRGDNFSFRAPTVFVFAETRATIRPSPSLSAAVSLKNTLSITRRYSSPRITPSPPPCMARQARCTSPRARWDRR